MEVHLYNDNDKHSCACPSMSYPVYSICSAYVHTLLKGTVARDFALCFFLQIEPTWAPDSYSKTVLNSVSNSPIYSNNKIFKV